MDSKGVKMAKTQTTGRTIVRCPHCEKRMLLSDVIIEWQPCLCDSTMKDQYYCAYCFHQLSAQDLMEYSIKQEKRSKNANL